MRLAFPPAEEVMGMAEEVMGMAEEATAENQTQQHLVVAEMAMAAMVE